ncbi:hypothetical protein [Comamonas sp.]|uniref:hypothetical protein n=1 Tax=Comamonas sp. TaxID=34028 RepID=UPI0028992E0E|nr:hypothetical protein [Comamonas sp.]
MRDVEGAIVIVDQVTAPIRLWSYAAVLLAGLAAGAAAGWQVQAWRLGSTIATLKQDRSDQAAADQRATREKEQTDRRKEQQHATASNTNEAQFIDDLKKLAGSEARRADDADRRADEYRRLRDGATSREATTRAWAKAESTARDDLANRLVTLEGQLERGIGVVDRGLVVVGRLQGDLERRDAEVAAQQRQIRIERELNGSEKD